MIEGVNFPARLIEGADGPVGFFATREVEADNPESAELAAIEMVKAELRPRMGDPRDGEAKPMMYLDEIIELESLREDAVTRGLSWYVMDKS